MLKILLKKQLYELNYTFFYDRKRGKARSKATSITYIVLYALLMIVVIGGMFAGLSAMLCSPLTSIGLDWLYFDIMTLMALLFGVFGGVFNTYSSLYKAKDNDLMLSLPIPTRYILLSRLIGVYLMGLMFSATVMLPADIVYFIVGKPAFAGVFGSLLLTILVSVFVFILSCALGWVVAKVSSKLKSKSLIVVVLSLVFFGLYYFVCFNASELLQKLILNAAGIGESIQRLCLYPLRRRALRRGRPAVDAAADARHGRAVFCNVFHSRAQLHQNSDVARHGRKARIPCADRQNAQRIRRASLA